MKAVSYDRFGSVDVLNVGDHPAPRPGDRVTINGASGGVGLFAVQIASLLGGTVVGICSARNAGLVRELGASEVIPYDEREPPAKDRRCDAFFDVFGNRPYPLVRPDLGRPHRHATTVPSGRAILREITSRLLGHSVRMVLVKIGATLSNHSVVPRGARRRGTNSNAGTEPSIRETQCYEC